jgi:hypothetical protein
MSAGTATGDTGADLYLRSKYATSTRDVATTSVVVTDVDGYIKQEKLDLTEDYIWSGEHNFASTTLSASTTVAYPTASSSPTSKGYTDNLVNNFNTTYISSGVLELTASGVSTTTLGYSPSLVRISAMAKVDSTNEGVYSEGGYSVNGGNNCINKKYDGNGGLVEIQKGSTNAFFLNAPISGTAKNWTGVITTFATGFVITATKTDNIGNAFIYYEALR